MAEGHQNEEVKGSPRKSKLRCSHCNKFLSSKQNLREHLYIHTGEKPYVCDEPECGESFRQGSLYSIHKKIHSEIKKALMPEVLVPKPTYPKLTTLIPTSPFIHQTLTKHEIESLTSQVPLNKFSFIKEFLT